MTLSLNQAWATESTDCLADDTMSQYKTNYRAGSMKGCRQYVPKISSVHFPWEKTKTALIYFIELKRSRKVRRHEIQTTYNYSKLK